VRTGIEFKIIIYLLIRNVTILGQEKGVLFIFVYMEEILATNEHGTGEPSAPPDP
jgi:hypothetical protein